MEKYIKPTIVNKTTSEGIIPALLVGAAGSAALAGFTMGLNHRNIYLPKMKSLVHKV